MSKQFNGNDCCYINCSLKCFGIRNKGQRKKKLLNIVKSADSGDAAADDHNADDDQLFEEWLTKKRP